MKFVCSSHGEIKPHVILDSCPARSSCPICGERMVDLDGGIKIIEDEKEAVLMRPEWYKKTHPDVYKKYFPIGD